MDDSQNPTAQDGAGTDDVNELDDDWTIDDEGVVSTPTDDDQPELDDNTDPDDAP